MSKNVRLVMLALVVSAMFLGGCKPFGRHKHNDVMDAAMLCTMEPSIKKQAEEYNDHSPYYSRKRMNKEGEYYDKETGKKWDDFMKTDEGKKYQEDAREKAFKTNNESYWKIWQHDFCK
jgi:hypothetical protein